MTQTDSNTGATASTAEVADTAEAVKPRRRKGSKADFSTALAKGNTGRDSNGLFARGNKGGPGGSYLIAQYNKLRTALMRSVSTGDIQEIMQCVIKQAKSGDINACKLVLDYTVGKAQPPPAPDEGVIRNAVAVQVNVPLDLKGMSVEQLERIREMDQLLAADRGEVQEVAYSTVSQAQADEAEGNAPAAATSKESEDE